MESRHGRERAYDDEFMFSRELAVMAMDEIGQ